ncbi:META domain-containing protein [Rhodohalobacter sulfatireducens]|uniref:META domain-containing protein n=1 Tax=Rhodohalobacter sulfatireducens TaxID=2911366 RepID=A0ABS9KGJ8_9BACT|nr:META domain-containing protein [Rhodohalobacter sulfatireducens]MCG2589976.1 META domain-containing protein [Rhodohalobacter sulfatireducens]MDR9366762.1 META domain-containing protein [Balneolaceae bacterium]MDR9409156.1 META domain-containing protein [Balneolaceae bacterium]
MPIEKEKSHLGILISQKNSLVLLLLFIFSCSDFGRHHTTDRITLERPWELVTFIDSNGNELDLYDYEVHTLRFLNESEFAGEAACNHYGGKYAAKNDGKITVGEFYITEALCRQPSWGEEFAGAITKVKKYELEDGRLILLYDKLGILIFNERLE